MLGFDTLNTIGNCIQNGTGLLSIKITVAKNVAASDGVTAIWKADSKCQRKTGMSSDDFLKAKKALLKEAEL